jgi:hypothetical protein
MFLCVTVGLIQFRKSDVFAFLSIRNPRYISTKTKFVVAILAIAFVLGNFYEIAVSLILHEKKFGFFGFFTPGQPLYNEAQAALDLFK